ncbi:MAG: hypothetical protein KAI47_16835 [Deltaproteobacteria bacterium]|nr:hypothetical protein [Deltaproteobacteria bacterium]
MTPARADVSQADVVKEVKAAFQKWSAITCSDLRFDIQPVLSVAPQPLKKDGGILVAFMGPGDPSTLGSNAYFSSSTIELFEKGNLTNATIQFNASAYNWVIGKQKQAIDIQTAVLHLIPNTLGFYVGGFPKTQSSLKYVTYNNVDHTLLPEHEAGARFMYFKDDSSGCTQTLEPHVCGEAVPTPDAGMPDAGPSDAGPVDARTTDTKKLPPTQLCIFHSTPNDKANGKPNHWETQPITVWIYAPAGGVKPPPPDGSVPPKHDGAPVVGDGGANTDAPLGKSCTSTAECAAGEICSAEHRCVSLGGGDDGCCRVAHTMDENITATAFFLFGVGLVLWRRRRRRR